MKQAEKNLWLDLGLFVTFLSTIISGFILWLVIPHKSAVSFLGFDHHFWQTIHIYASLVSIVGIVIHVVWHKSWLKAVGNRLASTLPRKIKANRVVNRIIWVTFLAASAFGIISWVIQNNEFQVNIFSRLHVVLAICWLMGIVFHLVFHRRWIISIIKVKFFEQSRNAGEQSRSINKGVKSLKSKPEYIANWLHQIDWAVHIICSFGRPSVTIIWVNLKLYLIIQKRRN